MSTQTSDFFAEKLRTIARNASSEVLRQTMLGAATHIESLKRRLDGALESGASDFSDDDRITLADQVIDDAYVVT